MTLANKIYYFYTKEPLIASNRMEGLILLVLSFQKGLFFIFWLLN